jgi:hypothetical protein
VTIFRRIRWISRRNGVHFALQSPSRRN